MTNTPQSMSEEELRKKLEDQLRVAYTWGLRAGVLSEADKPRRAESDGKGLMQGVDEFMLLITQYSLTKQLEARADELENRLRVQFIPSHWERLRNETNSWAKYVDRRISELKQQLGKDKEDK